MITADEASPLDDFIARRRWRIVAAFTAFMCLGALGMGVFFLASAPTRPAQTTSLEVVGSLPTTTQGSTQAPSSTAPVTRTVPTVKTPLIIIPPSTVRPAPRVEPKPPHTVCRINND